MNIRRRVSNHRFLSSRSLNFARGMRKEPTDAERKLWRHLRHLPNLSDTHFRRQVSFGRYIVDFASHKARMIIEVDGGQHSEHLHADKERAAFLEGEGYRVLRFWNTDVMTNIDGVLEEIARALTPTPNPSPQGGGE